MRLLPASAGAGGRAPHPTPGLRARQASIWRTQAGRSKILAGVQGSIVLLGCPTGFKE